MIAVALAGGAVADAVTAPVAVEGVLASHLAATRRGDGGVAILLPTTLALRRPVYGSRVRRLGGYELVIGSSPRCDGANICTLADFAATPGARLYGTRTALADAIAGAYSPAHCAGDCTPATIAWREQGVLYTIAARPDTARDFVRSTLIDAANQAIDAGPR